MITLHCDRSEKKKLSASPRHSIYPYADTRQCNMKNKLYNHEIIRINYTINFCCNFVSNIFFLNMQIDQHNHCLCNSFILRNYQIKGIVLLDYYCRTESNKLQSSCIHLILWFNFHVPFKTPLNKIMLFLSCLKKNWKQNH